MPTPTTRRRILLASLVIVTGCVAFEPGTGWEETPSHKPMTPVFREVDGETLARYCGHGFAGCCWRDHSTGLAWIYTRPNPPQWLVDHELHHAKGYDHLPWTRQHVVTFRR